DRWVIAHSFGSGFILIPYDVAGKDEDWELRGWMRADRADTGRLRRKEDLASRPPPMEKRGLPRRGPETGAPGRSSKKPEKPQRQRSIIRHGASSRFRVAQRCTQQPNKSTEEPTDNTYAFETARATYRENPR